MILHQIKCFGRKLVLVETIGALYSNAYQYSSKRPFASVFIFVPSWYTLICIVISKNDRVSGKSPSSVVVNVEGVCNSYYKQCYDFFGTSNT